MMQRPLTKQAQNKFATAQAKTERSILNITYKDRKTNVWVREKTRVIDIISNVRIMKWSWAGRFNRLKDDRWTTRKLGDHMTRNDNKYSWTWPIDPFAKLCWRSFSLEISQWIPRHEKSPRCLIATPLRIA